MSDKEQADTVSVEAHQRVVRERDELKQKIQEAEQQASAARKVSTAESFLRRKGIPEDDLTSRMELISPHLAQMDLDAIEEQLSSDRFKLVVTGATTPSADDGGDDDTGEPETPPSEPPAAPGFGGPNPGGTELPPSEKKYTLRSPEVQGLIQRNDRAGLEKLYKEGRIQEPVRNY